MKTSKRGFSDLWVATRALYGVREVALMPAQISEKKTDGGRRGKSALPWKGKVITTFGLATVIKVPRAKDNICELTLKMWKLANGAPVSC